MTSAAKRLDQLSPQEKRALLSQLVQKRSGQPRTFPLSFAQQRMWFLDQLDPGSPVHRIRQVVRLEGRIHIPELYRSFNEIVRRHQALRTTFHVAEGEPVQVVAPAAPLSIPVVDLGELPEREAVMQQVAGELVGQPLDLATGPLIRVNLIRTGEDDHTLVILMHHIISDGWSMSVFIREFTALYQAFSEGRPSPLPELPIQYVDYAAWQRQRLQGETLAAQLAYWKAQLQDAPTRVELLADRPRPPVQTSRGARQWRWMPPSLAEALKALSHRENATLFMTLLAAFKTLLYRYTGQDSILVGTPIANRNRVEIEGLIGFFLNTLVLRTDLSGSLRFWELLQRVRETALDAYAHQDLPFEKLVEALRLERDLSRNPLFQVMFILQNVPAPSAALPGLELSQVPVQSDLAVLDLTLEIEDTPRGLLTFLEYNTDLFDDTTIQRMLEHFQILLEGIAANPEQRLSELPLLSEAERRQVLLDWNDTRADFDRQRSIHRLFEAQAGRTPDAVAVWLPEADHLTYGELDRRATQLARHLQSRGLGPDVRAAICMERSPEMIVAVLGVLKAGGAYLPLDPFYPKERLASMLQDGAPAVVLTQAALAPVLPECGAPLIRLDTDWPIVAVESSEPVRCDASADHLAYVIYTSGSTGAPKGVMVQHRSLVNYVEAAGAEFDLQPGDRVLQFTSLSWDTAAEEIYPCLTRGGTLVLRPGVLPEPAAEFLQHCQAWAITLLSLPTAYWHELASALDSGSVVCPPCVRLVCFGGERAFLDPLLGWQRGLGRQARLINTYGATEATAVTTWCDVSGLAQLDSGLANVPIGRPVPNARVYILDRHLQPVPVGVPGELCIGGEGLARGYLDRPDLTAERFVPDPFTPAPAPFVMRSVQMGQGVGARLYRSGDKARYLAGGDIEFLGRMDRQVKIRGYRVELGEIEAALNQHPAVRESAVLVWDSERGPMDRNRQTGKPGRLVAYVALAEAHALTPDALREFLREKLPGYMTPSALVLLEALPHTPGGKLDPRSLPAPAGERAASEAHDAPPRTEIEQAIAAVWREVLQVERVGLHDNFFDLGGHSLLVLRVQSKLQGALNRNISTIELFKYPTIRLLADHLADDPGKLPPLRPRPDHDEARLESLERQKQSLEHRRAFRQTRRKSHRG